MRLKSCVTLWHFLQATLDLEIEYIDRLWTPLAAWSPILYYGAILDSQSIAKRYSVSCTLRSSNHDGIHWPVCVRLHVSTPGRRVQSYLSMAAAGAVYIEEWPSHVVSTIYTPIFALSDVTSQLSQCAGRRAESFYIISTVRERADDDHVDNITAPLLYIRVLVDDRRRRRGLFETFFIFRQQFSKTRLVLREHFAL